MPLFTPYVTPLLYTCTNYICHFIYYIINHDNNLSHFFIIDFLEAIAGESPGSNTGKFYKY